MPIDVEDAFAGLVEESGLARLAPAAELRRRGNRRRAGRVIAAVLVLAVAGSVVAGQLRASRSSVGPAAVGEVPASVFLQRSDVPGAVEPMQTYVGGLPPWCGLPRLSLAELRAAGGWMVAYIQAGASAHGRVTSTIEVFRKEAVAQSWMGMLREQVARCPQDVVGLATYRNQLLDTPIPSEPDSVLISVSSFGLTTYYAVFRRGDVIEVVANTAPGGLGDRLATVHLATRASARLAAWRR